MANITKKELLEVIKLTVKTILAELQKKNQIEEDTTTGEVGAINLPGSKTRPSTKSGWVAKKGGSLRGVEGSPSGMELTPVGTSDMKRKQDPVY